MATATRPDTEAGVELAQIVATLERVAHARGFHTTKNPIRTSQTGADLTEKIRVFMAGYLTRDRRGDFTYEALKTEIYHVERKPPLGRKRDMPNAFINELTLAWMCVFMERRYHTSSGLGIALGALKEIVCWLVKDRYEYPMGEKELLMSAAALNWPQNGHLWTIVAGNDRGFT